VGALFQSQGHSGGITDRFLSDYPNMCGDLSAGSPQCVHRDEDHARQFILRHQDKLLYGSDCQRSGWPRFRMQPVRR